MQQVNTRQTYLILILSAIAFKLLVLPSMLAKSVGRDSYVTMLIGQLIEFAILGIFIYLNFKYPTLTFKQMMQKIFGNIIARITLFFYGIYFLGKTVAIFVGFYVYLGENLYTTLPWYVYAIPTAFVVFYVIMCGLKNIARLIEFFMPLLIISALLCLFMGLISSDFTNVLPMFEKGFFNTFNPLIDLSVWFGNFLIYIVLMGNIKQNKNHIKKIIILSGIIIFFVTLFYVIYNCIYIYNGANYTNAFSDITSIVPRNSYSGGLYWIVVMIWCIAIFLFVCLSAYSSSYCFKESITHKRSWIIDIIISSAVVGFSFLLNFNIGLVADIFVKYSKYLGIIVQYLLPLLVLAFSFRLKENRIKKELQKAGHKNA